MNKLSKSILVFSCLIFFSMPLIAQETTAKTPAPAVAETEEAGSHMTEEMMQKWMAAATPGEHHQWLSAFYGNWKTENKSYWDPKSEPMVSTGTSKCEMILGGRFLKVESSLPVMDMTMNGLGYLGYDNDAKEYFMFWIDNIGTSMYTAKGQREGNVLTMYGTMDDPMTGEKNKPVKYVYNFKNANTYHFAIYDNAGTPDEFLAMEENVTRVLEGGIGTTK